MTNVRLEGRSKKGKQLVKECGEDWDVKEIRQTILFDDLPGPWLLASSKDGTKVRWVHKYYDLHLGVV